MSELMEKMYDVTDIDIDKWQRELLAAGWKKGPGRFWISPDGFFMYRGPYQAWYAMKGGK